MQVLDFSEFTQDLTRAFNMALVEEVIINYVGGNKYKLSPIKQDASAGKSPLENIPRVKLNITTQEIVEIFNECRAGV
jgi:hypothetical protein